MDIRAVVIERMAALGVSRYLLAQRLEREGIRRRAVLHWLSGKGETNTKTLGVMLDLLGLALTETPGEDAWDMQVKVGSLGGYKMHRPRRSPRADGRASG